MKAFILNGHNMSDYYFTHQIAANYDGNGNAKEIVATIYPATSVLSYRVTDHKKLVIDTQDFEKACKYYENI